MSWEWLVNPETAVMALLSLVVLTGLSITRRVAATLLRVLHSLIESQQRVERDIAVIRSHLERPGE